MSKEEDERKPKPPVEITLPIGTNKLLEEILSTTKDSLAVLNQIQNGVVFNNQKMDQMYEMSAINNKTLISIDKTLNEIEHTVKSSLLVQEESRDYLKQIAKSIPPPEKHVYSLVVRQINLLTKKPKEGKMAIPAGKATAFGVAMQDNGFDIVPPAGNVYAWGTDDSTDVIAAFNADASIVTITVSDPPASGRDTCTITAEGTAPDGSVITSPPLAVPIVGTGIPHVYTLTVNQLVAQQLPERGSGSAPKLIRRKK